MITAFCSTIKPIMIDKAIGLAVFMGSGAVTAVLFLTALALR